MATNWDYLLIGIELVYVDPTEISAPALVQVLNVG